MKDAFKAVLSFILKILNAVKTVLLFLLCHPLLGGIVLGPVLIFGIALVASSLEDNPSEQDDPTRKVPVGRFARDRGGLYEWTGGFVLDAAGMLSTEQNEELSGYLLELNDTTGVQIAVLTLQTTGREPIHDFAVRQFEKWQLGQKGIDNGALLSIALADRKTDITTGDGIEGVLTDILCKTILDNVIAPAFREEKYGEGIIGAVHAMADTITRGNSLVTEETTPEAEDEIADTGQKGDLFDYIYDRAEEKGLGLLAIVIFVLLAFLFCGIVLLRLPVYLVSMIFDGPPDSVGEFFYELVLGSAGGNFGRFWILGGGSSRSGGGGHTSGGGASSGW